MTPDTSPRLSSWTVVRAPRPEDVDLRERWIDALMSESGQGVVEEEDALLVYLPDTGEEAGSGTDDPRVAKLRSALAGLGDSGSPEPVLSVRVQPHEDWAEIWREGFLAQRITPRIVVAPSWTEPEISRGDVVITLDPGMAFGTAEHATTRGCLRLIDERVEPGSRWADIGAGSGILSIALALLGAEAVLAVESDTWSAEVVRENAELNGVAHLIEVRARRVGPGGLPGDEPFDGLVANIEAGVLEGLIPGLASAILPGGWIVLSGILPVESERIIRRAAQVGLDLTDHDLEDDWWSGCFRLVSN